MQGSNVSKVTKGPRDSKFQGIEGPLVDKGFQGHQKTQGLQSLKDRGSHINKRFQGIFNELASPKNIPKGFREM